MTTCSLAKSVRRTATVLAFVVLPFFTNVYAQHHSEIRLSNGEHARIETPKGGVSSIAIINGRVATVKKENPDERVRLIVVFKDRPLTVYHKRQSLQKSSASPAYAALQASHAAFRTALQDIGRQLSTQMHLDYSFSIRRDYYRALNGVAMECKRGMITRIRALPEVQRISLDGEVKADLTESVHQIRADLVQDSLGLVGEGVLVGEVDTGIDYDNPALGGGFGPGFRVIGGYDFAYNDNDPRDDHGHGTHVAGIIGANGGDTLRGVAPAVKFLAVKVLDASGSGLYSNVIAGIEYCLDPDGNPATDDAADVINMSLGGEPSTDSPLDSAVNNATRAGILCVVSAGNAGQSGYGTIESPGTSETALTVGACDSVGQIASFSSLGPDPIHSFIKPEVAAPGVGILSTVLNNQTASWSGTSMAAPHVTGVASLLRQEHPSWTPEEIKAAIVNTAHSGGESISVFAQGRGCVDALDAAEARMVVEPGVLNFGYVDLAKDVWRDTVQLAVRNFRSISHNLQIRTVEGLPQGATLTFDRTSFSLAPGEETAIQAILSVPSSVPVVPNEPFAYVGTFIMSSDSDNVVVPFGFIKSTTLVINFDLPPALLWLVDRNGGTIKEVHLQEGATKYIVPISQGYSLDLLANLRQDTLGYQNWYLVHHTIDNPTGLTYVLVGHDQATINMADDSVYDIHGKRIIVDSTAFAQVSFQVIVYDERSGQHLNVSNYEHFWGISPGTSRLFFPPLDSLFFIKKIFIVSNDPDNFILTRSIYGLRNRQDIAIATGADNLFIYPVTSSYDDPYLKSPSKKVGTLDVGSNTMRIEKGGWESESLVYRFITTQGNYIFNKLGVGQEASNDKYLHSSKDFSASHLKYLVDSTIVFPSELRTPEFTINERGEASFQQMRLTRLPSGSPMAAEISLAYTYESVKSGDTITLDQRAGLNFPDYMTYLNSGSLFMKCSSDWSSWNVDDVYGGVKQSNGVVESREPLNSFWNMPLFTTQAFAHNRAQTNAKPFAEGEYWLTPSGTDYWSAYAEFDNMSSSVGTLRVLSNAQPYAILGQAGQCTADFEYQIPLHPASNTLLPSFNLLQVAIEGRAVDVVRPDQAGILRLVLCDPDSNVTSATLSLLLASGDAIALPTSYVGGHEFDATIPSYVPTGYVDVVARVKDIQGNSSELTASPAFYFGTSTETKKLDGRLRMCSYTLTNVDSVTFAAGDTLKYTLSYINYGSDTARDVEVAFPTTPYFRPTGPSRWTIDTVGVNDTIHVPVSLLFLGRQRSTDQQTHYSPSIKWTSGGTPYFRSHKVLVDFQNTVTGVVQAVGMAPKAFALYQNYPNPFNPSTTIRYDVPKDSKVKLEMYDLLGRKVATLVDESTRAGSHQTVWDAHRLASGVYFCRMQAGDYTATKRLLLLK